jgi:hypothetical protein
LQESTNDGLLGSVDDLHNPRFWSPFAVQAGDSGDNTITVYDSTHFVRWQIHINLAIIALHEAMTVAVSLYSSLEGFKESCAWS